MAGGSLIFKQESQYYEHFYHQTEPWKHYVPLKDDVSDIEEKLNWALEHDKEVLYMKTCSFCIAVFYYYYWKFCFIALICFFFYILTIGCRENGGREMERDKEEREMVRTLSPSVLSLSLSLSLSPSPSIYLCCNVLTVV